MKNVSDMEEWESNTHEIWKDPSFAPGLESDCSTPLNPCEKLQGTWLRSRTFALAPCGPSWSWPPHPEHLLNWKDCGATFGAVHGCTGANLRRESQTNIGAHFTRTMVVYHGGLDENGQCKMLLAPTNLCPRTMLKYCWLCNYNLIHLNVRFGYWGFRCAGILAYMRSKDGSTYSTYLLNIPYKFCANADKQKTVIGRSRVRRIVWIHWCSNLRCA